MEIKCARYPDRLDYSSLDGFLLILKRKTIKILNSCFINYSDRKFVLILVDMYTFVNTPESDTNGEEKKLVLIEEVYAGNLPHSWKGGVALQRFNIRIREEVKKKTS